MKKIIPFVFMLSLLSNNQNTIGYCDIKGNVKKPGVYPVYEKSTIKNIIDEAGGLKKLSYTNNINLSKKVKDEMVIYIFSEEEHNNLTKSCECEEYISNPCINTSIPNITSMIVTTTASTSLPTTTTIKTTNQLKININTCTINDLININGLGEAKAKSIIEYRETNGLFKNINDLIEVKGIGPSIFEKIKDFIET